MARLESGGVVDSSSALWMSSMVSSVLVGPLSSSCWRSLLPTKALEFGNWCLAKEDGGGNSASFII